MDDHVPAGARTSQEILARAALDSTTHSEKRSKSASGLGAERVEGRSVAGV
jgi:hypothetical protein